MKELKEQIIDAVQDATDTVDGTVSIPILDHFLDGILNKQLSQPYVMLGLPVSKVVFFELKNGKYLASNGVEITTEFIFKHEHAIFHDNGYVIVERQ